MHLARVAQYVAGRPAARPADPCVAREGASAAAGAPFGRSLWPAVARGVAIVTLLVACFVAREVVGMQRAAAAGRQALSRAESSLRAGRVDAARARLVEAGRAFAVARSHVQRLRATLGAAGIFDGELAALDGLAAAGARAAAGLASLPVAAAGGADPLAGLRRARAGVASTRRELQRARDDIAALQRPGLAAPVEHALSSARRRLDRTLRQAREADAGLGALATFLGAGGPRRYLVLTQNPDEPRPTGGFIGAYGVLSARRGHVALERFASIESWYEPRRRAVVVARRAPPALRLPSPPVAQTLANVNAGPDWPTAARLAAALWRRGGERPVDGVLAVTPDLVARLLRPLGPMRVPGFRRAVSSRTVVATLDHYTHRVQGARGSRRKRLIVVLARRMLRRAVRRPGLWPRLAAQLVAGLDAREALAWSRDRDVRRALARRRWDGALPRVRGDFFYAAEFAYPTKNGRDLRRRFDHDVALRADGSARVTTTVTIHNASRLGYPLQTYIAIYGPAGALPGPGPDQPVAVEAPVAGHPAVGWLRFAAPWQSARVRVVWEVPRMLVRGRDGKPAYRLLWRRIPAHRGDVLHLRVTLPAGWRWAGAAPPRTSALRRDVDGQWEMAH